MLDAEFQEALPEGTSIREHVLEILQVDEVDIEGMSPVKKTWWPLADRRKRQFKDDDEQWAHDVRQVALRVVREGKPLDEMKFREGDVMKETVAAYLLDLAGYEVD